MTREKCKRILPIIQAFADGENVEYFDSMQITGTFTRGQWKTAENMGFGADVSSYRIVKPDGQIINFK